MTKSMLHQICFVFTLAWALSASADGTKFVPPVEMNVDHLKTLPQLSWGKDPFSRRPGYVPLSAADVVSEKQFKLDAIIYDEEDPIAIINGMTVGLDDDVDGLTVDQIGVNYVTLRGDDTHFELTLGVPKEPIRKAEIREEKVQ